MPLRHDEVRNNGSVNTDERPHEQPWAVKGRVVTPTRIIDDGCIVIDADALSWVGEISHGRAAGFSTAIDAADAVPGQLILPGLVDIHNHGGGGASFPDAENEESALIAAQEHLQHGTTSLVASLVTADRQTLLERTRILAGLADKGHLAGIHCEGPFLSSKRAGAQNTAFMQHPDTGLVREIASEAHGWFATMTVAPELDHASEVFDALVEAGAVPSIGHTDATAEMTEGAIAEAYSRLASAPNARSRRVTATHLFNAMRPIHHRDPGPVLACMAAARHGEVIVELIGDGVHLADATVHEVFDLLGPDSIMLVTDAMAAAGMADGEYELGPQHVRVAGGVARLANGDAIAGGTAHLLDVVRRCVQFAQVGLVDAVRAASHTPATVLGTQARIGALATGMRADFILTDDELLPHAVIRRGARVA